jgi:hypothetical protein
MKKIIRLTESDLARIVRRVISEQGEDAIGGGGSKTAVGSTLTNGIKIASEPKLDTRIPGVVFITKENGTGNEFRCAWHEKGQYLLYPTNNGKNTLTKEESQEFYNKFCK